MRPPAAPSVVPKPAAEAGLAPATGPAAGAELAELAELARVVRRAGLDAGLDAVGVAPATPFAETRAHLEARRSEGLHAGMQFTYRNPARSTEPGRVLPGAAALVVGARRYLRAAPLPAPAPEPDRPPPATGPVGRVARYSWEDHYAPLREALEAAAGVLRAGGFRAVVLADDNALVDREAAYRAGLGWYGKNTNLLLPGGGSWYVLGSVVTDAPLPPDRPVADGCGTCSRCLPACPTGAFIRPGVLDARRCLAWLVQAPGVFPAEFRVALGDRMYGCDRCQEVCPVNIKAAQRDPPRPAGAAAEAETDLLDVLASSDEALLGRFGRWYIPQRQPRYLRRNALIALGNRADPGDAAVVAALSRALADADPLVRGHAVWAAARLGRTDLLAPLAGETDPAVRAELDTVDRVEVRPVAPTGAGGPRSDGTAAE